MSIDVLASGLFGIVGTITGTVLGIVLTQLVSMYQNKPKLAFVSVGTPIDEWIEEGLRTKTSPSEWSIRICNIGKTACFLEKFYIVRKGYTLIECYDVCSDYNSIAPSNSILYTLMQQDADTLQYNYSKYYRSPNELYLWFMRSLGNIPVIRNRIVDPLFRQGECKVIAYTVNGKRIHEKIDLPLLYIRHAGKDSIAEA